MPSIIVIDNFYSSPKSVRQKAMKMDFVEPEELVGVRTTEGYFPDGFLKRLSEKSGLNITDIQMPQGTPYDNGTYFLSCNSGKQKEVPGIHWDEPLHHYLCLVYLTEDIPVNCGTAFFTHRKTGLDTAPTEKEARKRGMTKKELISIIERDSKRKNRFIETDRVGYKFNRAVIFPARRLHAASNHYGEALGSARIYQVFTFVATPKC